MVLTASASRIAATIYNILYVMAEGNQYQKSEVATRKTIFLFLIDFLQVIRVTTSTLYGWSEETQAFVQNFDVVYLFTDSASKVVPRYSFFILASVLVLVALADTLYVARLFSQDEVHNLWPVKVLRVLVAALVTTFFSSVIKWLLIPVDCLVTDERSLSFYMHGPGQKCNPWRSPEIFVAIPTLVLSAFYCVFALAASFFWLEINPLSCSPAAKCTGRVEISFLFMKIASTFLVYFASSITTTGTSVLLFLFTVGVFLLHLRTLPFHDKFINQVRGGIHAALMWLAFCAVIVSGTGAKETDNNPRAQNVQWAFIGCMPAAALAGAWAVAIRRNQLARVLDRLRGVWETSNTCKDASKEHVAPSANGENESAAGSKAPQAGGGVGMYAYFYNPTWERKRAFSSSSEAYAAVRLLLHKRQEKDIPFLLHVVNRAMEEFPGSHQLKVLYLLLVRFVFKDQEDEAVKKSTESLQLSMDLKYAIYAVERKQSQELASANLGRGTLNAISLMEYDSGLERARKAHLECITHLKTFWHLVGTRQGSKNPLNLKFLPDKMLQELAALERASSNAQEAYESLLHKYPSSLAVLQGFSHFCDVVKNDGKRAQELREKALQEENEGAGAIEQPNRLDDVARRSQSSGSESASWRSRVSRSVMSWIHKVMATEAMQVVRLRSRERLLVCLLVLGITASFVASNVVLYSTEAKKYMRLVRRAGELRISIVTAAHDLRNQMMFAHEEDENRFRKAQSTIVDVAEEIRNIHFENYKNVVSPSIADMYNSPVFAVFVPTGGFWTPKRLNLWDMVNDAARRSELAARSTMEEMTNGNFSLPVISEQKRNLAYVQENWMRTLSPSLDTLITGYEREMQKIGRTINSVVYSSCAGSSLVILVLCLVVMRSLTECLQNLQHKQIACMLAVSLPRSVSRKLYLFYKDVDIDVRIMEDEEMQRAHIEELQLDCENGAGTEDWSPADAVDGATVSLTIHNVAAHVRQLDSPKVTPGRSLPALLPIHVHSEDLQASGFLDDALAASRQRAPPQIDAQCPASAFRGQLDMAVARKMGTSLQVHSDPCAELRAEQDEEEVADQYEVSPHGSEPNEVGVVVRTTIPPIGDCSRSPVEDEQAQVDEQSRSTIQAHEESLDEEGHQVQGIHTAAVEVAATEDEVIVSADDPSGALCADAPSRKEQHNGLEEPSVLMSEVPQSFQPTSQGKTEDNGDHDLKPDGAQGGDQSTASTKEVNAGDGHGKEVQVNIHFGREKVDDETPDDRRAQQFMDAACTMKDTSGFMIRATSGTPSNGIDFSKRDSGGKVKFANLEPHESQAQPVGRRSSLKIPEGKRSPCVAAKAPQKPEEKEGNSIEDDCGVSEGFEGNGDERMALTPIDPDFRKRVKELLTQKRSFVLQTSVYVSCFLLLLGYNLMFHLYPARTIHDLVNLAPMIDQASRRVFLTLALSNLARELVLDDGFSRLSKPSLVGAIEELSERLESSNHAIRFGNSLGIKTGADERNDAHNRIMYAKGCPWRTEDGQDSQNCAMISKPHAADSGLLFLVNTYLDSLQSVVMRYAPSTQPDQLAFQLEADGHVPSGFEHVVFSPERAAKLKSDPDVAFLEENFEGDMTKGFRLIMNMFSAEADKILAEADAESELLYAIFILLIIICYHVLLFRKTVRVALAEVDKAKEFVLRQPIHTLEDQEHQVFASFFSPDIEIGIDRRSARRGSSA